MTTTVEDPHMAAGRSKRPSRILVLDKMGAVLDAFRGGLERAGPAEIAERIGTNKSTTYRILRSMEHVGLLDRHLDGTYVLGISLMELGALVSERLDLRRLAEPALRRLRDEVGQTAFLTVRHEGVATCIDRIAGSHVEVMALRLGGSLPLYCGAAPRVLLAGLDNAELEHYLAGAPFQPRTPHTLVDADALREDVIQTRRQGYALSLEDATLGVAALGAPIFDRRGHVVAAISIAGLRLEYDDRHLPGLIKRVRLAAETASAAIGGPGNGWA